MQARAKSHLYAPFAARARENRHGDAGITGKVVMISALTCLYTILYISEDKASLASVSRGGHQVSIRGR